MTLFNNPKVAQEWIDSVENHSNSIRETDLYPKIKTWIEGVNPTSILDLGCGQGICSEKINLEHRDYKGVDLSPLMIARAKQQYLRPNCEFLIGDLSHLPFLDKTFDAAFSISVWHLIENLEPVLTETQRVLKPSGHFLSIIPNPKAYELWESFYRAGTWTGHRFEGGRLCRDQTIVQEVLYLPPWDVIQSALTKAHLRVEKIETFRTDPTSLLDYYMAIYGVRTDT